MITNFFAPAWRNIIRQRAFASINVIGLSIGLTSCLVLIIFARYETSFDQFQPFANRTFKVVQQFKMPEQTLYWNTTAYPLAEALRSDFKYPIVTQASGPDYRPFKVIQKDGSTDRFEDLVLFADEFYPQAFDLKWLAGNPSTSLTQPNSVILTASVAKRCFGSESDFGNVLGKSIYLNEEALVVTGVVADAPGNTSLQYKLIVSYRFYQRNNQYQATNWSGNYQGTTFIVLDDAAKARDLEVELARWQKKYLKPEDDARIVYKLQSLHDVHNDARYGSSPGSYAMPMRNVYAAYAVAAFILIIACVNFVNLATAQAATRAKEVGVRKMMGSTRWVLIRQFILENALLIACTLLVSLGLTSFVLDLLNGGLSIIHLSLRLQWTDLGVAVGVGAIAVALAAVYPAIVLARFNPAEILKNRNALTHSRGGSLRRSLIIVQFVIVQLFMIATIVVWEQMNFFKSKELGFQSEAIIKIQSPRNTNDITREHLSQVGGVERVTFGSGPPLSVDGYSLGTSFRLSSQLETEGQEAEMKGIDTSYLSFFHLELIAGRNITALKDPFDEFIINEKAARAMGWTPEEAIGQRLTVNEGEATVVGVVKDFHNNTLQQEITPCVMMNWAAFQEVAFVKLSASGGDQATVLADVEKTWRDLFPDKIYKYSFLTDAMQRAYTLETIVLRGFSIFSLISILIGAMGLLGMISFMTARKTKEVGIRKVLGASVQQIVILFSREFVWLVGIGFLIASPLVYLGMSRWLQDFAYRIALSWWMFALGGTTAVLLAIATVFVQSARAAMANPVKSLRSE
jgi:ABC-type antimicrobial peptide transport system permease subunit